MIRDGVRRVLTLALRRRDRWEREVEEEIKTHLAFRAEQLAAEGRSADEAVHEAVRRFGPLNESRANLLEAARHREGRMQRTEYLSDLGQDIGFALRTLRRQKAWTTITLLTFALGIGATTAVFSVVSSLLLHAVPYPNGDRVVVVQQQPQRGNNTGLSVSITPEPRIVDAWRARNTAFEALEPYRSMGLLLRTNEDPLPTRATYILPSFPSFAGARPLIGRMFTAQDIESNARVALISEGIWRERFASDNRIIGQSITLSDSAYTVIGVMPATMRLPTIGRDRTDFWLPLDMRNPAMGLSVVGRLRPGAEIPAVTRELDAITRQTGSSKPGEPTFDTMIRRPAELIQFHDSLLLLAGSVALVLLVACANVAHLLLVRGASRERELGVRMALGAGRWRLLRQLLTESLVLSLAGTAAGIALGLGLLRAIVALRPPSMPELATVRLDLTTLGVAIGAAVVCGVAFGIIAAVQASGRAPHDTLRTGARGASSSRGQERLRAVLVTSEMALSATLIVVAALLIRTVINLQNADLGFEPRNLYWAPVTLPKDAYATPAARVAFFDEMTSRLRATPHVREVSIAAVPVGSRQFDVGIFEIQGEATTGSAGTSFTDVNTVENGFFHTMGIPLLEGTLFTDTTAAANQIIVNAAFARAHWGPGGALGHRVRVADETGGDWKTIVGVVGDASTTGAGLVSTAPVLYSPLSAPAAQESIMIRTDAPIDLATIVRSVVKASDATIPTPKVESVESFVSRTIARPRFTMALLTAFTALALILAAVGLYGMMAYSVAQQTREIGIRMALGASAQKIATSVVRRGVSLAVAGAVVGLTGAYWATRLVSKLLYGVAPLDAASFAIGAIVLLATAVLACVVPTRRAIAVDPMTAIRAD